jgi:hypothetical protein
MPWGDRMGPMGLGPMTGRGTGYCAGYAMPGFANPWIPGWGGRGRGWWGRGRGSWGRGWRFWGWGRGRELRWGHTPYGYHPYYGYSPY